MAEHQAAAPLLRDARAWLDRTVQQDPWRYGTRARRYLENLVAALEAERRQPSLWKEEDPRWPARDS